MCRSAVLTEIPSARATCFVCRPWAIKLSGVRLPGEDSRRPLGRQRLTVGSRLGHRVVGVSRAEQPRGNAELRTGRPAVMAGSVEALVMCLRDRG
jgi:hypothetical protein